MYFTWRSTQVLREDHEVTERIFVSWMKNLHRASPCQRNDSIVDLLALRVSQSANSWPFCFESQSISESATTTVNSRSSCSSRSVDIQSIDDLYAFSSQSVHLSPKSLYNTHLLEALRHRLIKREIKATHTSNHLTNQQTTTQNQQQNFRFLDLLHSQHGRKIHAPLRFASVSASLSATMTSSEIVTTTS